MNEPLHYFKIATARECLNIMDTFPCCTKIEWMVPSVETDVSMLLMQIEPNHNVPRNFSSLIILINSWSVILNVREAGSYFIAVKRLFR